MYVSKEFTLFHKTFLIKSFAIFHNHHRGGLVNFAVEHSSQKSQISTWKPQCLDWDVFGQNRKGRRRTYFVWNHQTSISNTKREKRYLVLTQFTTTSYRLSRIQSFSKIGFCSWKSKSYKNQLVEQTYYHFGIDSIWRAKSTFLYAEIALDERKSSLLQKISHIGYLSTLIPRIMSE